MSFTVSLDQSWFIRGPRTQGPGSKPIGEVNGNIDVTVFPDWFKKVSLEWKVPSSWGNCKFNVYYRMGEDGSYTRLTSTPINSLHFTNSTTQDYSKFHSGKYVVEALIENRNLRVKSNPASWNHKRRDFIERRAVEIQRREYLLLSKFAGVKAFVFKKRMFGDKCPRCWSKETEKVMDDHCPVCYGTSFTGGYFDPIPSFIQFEPTPNTRGKTYYGNLEANQIGAWTISLPEISPDDIIIRGGDWNTYRVIQVQTTELQTNTVRQILTLTQMGRGDVENKLANRAEDYGVEKYVHDLGGEFVKDRFSVVQLDSNSNNDPEWFKNQDAPNLPEKYKL